MFQASLAKALLNSVKFTIQRSFTHLFNMKSIFSPSFTMPPPGLFQKHYKHAVQCSESLGESSVTWGFRGDWLGLTTLSVCLTTFDNAFSVCLFICSLVLTKGAFRSCKHYSHYSHYSLRFLLAHSLVANESIWPSAGSKSRLQQRWLFFVASQGLGVWLCLWFWNCPCLKPCHLLLTGEFFTDV